MGEAEQVSRLAEGLLTLAGGNIADRPRFYSVLKGGSDDIFGMRMSDLQLAEWSNLGTVGQKLYVLLCRHKDDQEKAYGHYCYDAKGIEEIFQEAGLQLELQVPA
jgi:hypothetical protein